MGRGHEGRKGRRNMKDGRLKTPTIEYFSCRLHLHIFQCSKHILEMKDSWTVIGRQEISDSGSQLVRSYFRSIQRALGSLGHAMECDDLRCDAKWKWTMVALTVLGTDLWQWHEANKVSTWHLANMHLTWVSININKYTAGQAGARNGLVVECDWMTILLNEWIRFPTNSVINQLIN